MLNYPKVGIVYLSYDSERYINDFVSAMQRISYPREKLELFVVDNPRPGVGNSMRALQEVLAPLSGKEIPAVTFLPQKENLGFAGGNNIGISAALQKNCDFVYLHNNDGFPAANFLQPLLETMEADKTIGAAQSMILLYPESDLINTAGNQFQYLGFGYCGDFRKKFRKEDYDKVFATAYASGAAVLLRADLLKEYGLLDADYFLYHEDIEYSFRLKTINYKTITVRDSIFFHKYNFARLGEKTYYMERNRFGLMLTYLKWPTLVLLLPMALVLEIALLLFAWKSGWGKQKLAVYGYWLKTESWKLWLGKRRKIKKMRKISDREFTKMFCGKILFQDTNFNSPVLRYIGNPLMAAYWFIVKKIIFW